MKYFDRRPALEDVPRKVLLVLKHLYDSYKANHGDDCGDDIQFFWADEEGTMLMEGWQIQAVLPCDPSDQACGDVDLLAFIKTFDKPPDSMSFFGALGGIPGVPDASGPYVSMGWGDVHDLKEDGDTFHVSIYSSPGDQLPLIYNGKSKQVRRNPIFENYDIGDR
jgi:hypothetical protein